MLKTAYRYFGRVVQTGSFRAAADSLNVAQSAVSRQIQALERDFGSNLFERRARGVVLTPTGEVLYRYFRDATFQIDRVRSEIDAIQGLRRGHVRVHCVESVIAHVVGAALDKFQLKHPGVTFEVFSGTSNEIARAVSDGEVEIGVAFTRPPAPDIKVVYRKRESLLAVMSPDHALARLRNLSLEQIAGWPVALPRRASGSRQLIDTACVKAGVTLQPTLESNSMELLRNYALSGQGVTFLSRLICLEALQSRALIARKLSDPIMNSGSLELVTLSGRKLPLAAEEFLIALRREIEQLPTFK
jgi:DNA-binding transcriptional LysR family regulator